MYRDLGTGNKVFFTCKMKVDEKNLNNVTIENSVIIQTGFFLNLLKPFLLPLINKKFDVMWKEDLEMLQQRFLLGDGKKVLCIDHCPKLYREFNKFPDITSPKHFDKIVIVKE